MKKRIYLLIGILFVIALIFFHGNVEASGDLYLNQLDFKINIQEDGSMRMQETWNIKIEETNTLFKTFKTDHTKYSAITDVQVYEIKNGNKVPLKQINTYMYHVTKGCYYGLNNSDGDFEIAWGVGLDNSHATRTYQIEYTVKDAITKYNDYAQLYWQVVGKDFEIPAKKVKGIIYLPEKASRKEDIMLWGHTRDLNGTIYATDTNKVEFDLDRYQGKSYIEIRTLFPSSLLTSAKRTYSSYILEKAIKEETTWAEEANRRREREKQARETLISVAIVTSVIIAIILLGKNKKYRKVLKELVPYQPTQKLEYYRDLPDETATPGEAVFLLKKTYQDYNFGVEFGSVFSATLLNLTLKQYIGLEVDKTKKGKNAISIINLQKEATDLNKDEAEILSFLQGAFKDNHQINMVQLERYIKDHVSRIETTKDRTFKGVKSSMISKKYFDEKELETYTGYMGKLAGYITFAILCFIAFPISIACIINAVYCYKIMKRINVLTQEGVDQQEMWKGLKKYMEDFSLLKEREVPELTIWERYLVYATAFGIADKVLKQLKLVYPNLDDDTFNTSAYMYFMYHSDFNTSFSSAINTSIASATMSSGSGSGGGFSGGGGFGGGGRRRRRPIIESSM